MQDNEMIALFLARDERALSETQAQYGGLCRQVAMNILENASDSEECVNDTLLRAWNSIPPNRPLSLKAYLIRITRNLALNRLRDDRCRRRYGGYELSLEELAECIPAAPESDAELTSCINAFLATLDDRNRDLFVGRYWYGYRVDVLARAHGLTRNTVNQRLARIRERMRIYLEERGYRI